ncbi:putative NADH dehydrogenase [ubiquinone] 1 alpha subcomplex subunit 5, mitochondrial [Auxenochlorella protothecoides]|uniref:Putative NADH dehydrogenase [ubiquinone] 1 alpha subcomplex subunit 5, mitochondrial n=1 Tax=Auxenochlorella protothecoides TaxID=3075 RepID=A0A087SIW8_AUXPR|nr:putative NADH dehydrogenase [ubiquinone] 1 alpha subcomplex subunit 5, mitochondrial [Auxenochlorella protothecoides]KFM25672.1 putative NADH dehydrogenase [ubiquinone] 1 alpha subcomplex subunit 5, mitochondrial [Auxenochlorella protothecoides]
MLTLARAHRVVSSRLALQSLATRCKTTTGIVGLPVDEDARTTLGEHYAKVLEAITVIPESAVYRQSVEKTVKHRLAALQTGAEDEELEQQFGRQLEEEIKIMKDELKLIPKMAEWRPWEVPEDYKSDLFPCNAGDDDLPGVATQESSLNPAPPSPEHRWPPAASWTTLEQEYAYRTISISFEEETLPGVLSSVIMSEDRLLRLYESGLPGWAVLLPRLGIYYRPWVRRVTWILFYIFSIVSLAAGFYDLYRNLPGVQALFNMVVARFWGPSVLFRWLEAHAQVRLSLLLTFLLGKSEWLVVGVRLLRTAGRALSTLLGPHMAGLWGGACALAGAFTPALSAARQLLDLAVMPLTLVGVSQGVLLVPRD